MVKISEVSYSTPENPFLAGLVKKPHITLPICLAKCLYATSYNPIDWIVQCGPSMHFRIDGPDRLYGF